MSVDSADTAPLGASEAPRAPRWRLCLAATFGRLSGPRALALLVLGLLLALRLFDPPALERARVRLFDAWQIVTPAPAPAPLSGQSVRIVDIDEASLRAHGQWPWPRTTIAQLTEALLAAGAVVVGFDMVFAEPDRLSPARYAARMGLPAELRRALAGQPDTDAALAARLTGAPVVLGISATHERRTDVTPHRPHAGITALNGDPRPYLYRYNSVLANRPELEAAAAGSGMFSLHAERDGLIRRVPAVLSIADSGRIHPSLALEMLRVAQGAPGITVISDAHGAGLRGLRVAETLIPTDANGMIWLRHRAHEPARYLSAKAVLDGALAPGALNGAYVLIGTSAVGLRDLRATPVQASIPGVEIHAQLLDMMLSGQYLTRPAHALGYEVALMLGLSLGVIVLVPRLGARASMATLGLLALAPLALSYGMFAQNGVLFDGAYPALGVAATGALLLLGNYGRAEAQRRRIRRAFGQYMAPALVEQLAGSAQDLRTGGELREMSFLFTDVAGFTAMVERTAPDALVRLLNRYLDGVCRLVIEHGGTIDKIVGDAVHVIFNAPLDQADHAARAVTCAAALDRHCEAFVADQAGQGVAFGTTRIGVNTGRAVIGNFGGEQRFDYTAHGDAINTAARLEGANKYFGTRVCLAGHTVALCPDLPVRPIGTVNLAGKAQPLELFEPARPDDPRTAPAADYRAAFAQLDAEPSAAEAGFAELHRRYPQDGLVAYHHKRLSQGKRGTRITLGDK